MKYERIANIIIMHSACLICPNMFHSKTSVLVKFSSTIYTATEGMNPWVTITLVANGAVYESSFSVRVIAKNGTATSGYIHAYTLYIHIKCLHTLLCR